MFNLQSSLLQFFFSNPLNKKNVFKPPKQKTKIISYFLSSKSYPLRKRIRVKWPILKSFSHNKKNIVAQKSLFTFFSILKLKGDIHGHIHTHCVSFSLKQKERIQTVHLPHLNFVCIKTVLVLHQKLKILIFKATSKHARTSDVQVRNEREQKKNLGECGNNNMNAYICNAVTNTFNILPSFRSLFSSSIFFFAKRFNTNSQHSSTSIPEK